VSDPADLTHGVLLRVADFLRKLPADQLAALADGTAKLEVVPKGGRRAPAAKPAPVTAEQVRAELARIGDRAAGRRWLADQGLTVPQLKELVKDLGLSVPSKARKDDVLDHIIQWTVGRQRDWEAISRPAPARF
jgi:hypothetical protein